MSWGRFESLIEIIIALAAFYLLIAVFVFLITHGIERLVKQIERLRIYFSEWEE